MGVLLLKQASKLKLEMFSDNKSTQTLQEAWELNRVGTQNESWYGNTWPRVTFLCRCSCSSFWGTNPFCSPGFYLRFWLKVKVAQSCLSLCDPMDYTPWNSPGQNSGVGSMSLLQGIFPTQGSNSGLPHCRWILYQLSHQGSPKILEWVAYPFSSRSARPRNRTQGSPALQADSLPAEPRGKPKNIGVGSLSLLQWIFFPQEMNWGLLHGRQIFTSWAIREAREYSEILIKLSIIFFTELEQKNLKICVDTHTQCACSVVPNSLQLHEL